MLVVEVVDIVGIRPKLLDIVVTDPREPLRRLPIDPLSKLPTDPALGREVGGGPACCRGDFGPRTNDGSAG